MTDMKAFVEFIVKNIVEKPDMVVITETVDASGKILLEIAADASDIGLVIGRQGKTINSIRDLAKKKAIKEGKYVDIKVPSGNGNGTGAQESVGVSMDEA